MRLFRERTETDKSGSYVCRATNELATSEAHFEVKVGKRGQKGRYKETLIPISVWGYKIENRRHFKVEFAVNESSAQVCSGNIFKEKRKFFAG